ncbi:MAG: hypothetical protein N2320_00070 [Candidatus Bipolaricaulota bacterium]|nr:hypothetical protein [Candidatus Bipolaricaulota bacterium]
MELWRVVLIAALALGVVLLLLPAPQEVPGLAGGTQIEGGTYVLVREGKAVGEEVFSLWLVDGLYRIESTGRREGEGFASLLVLDRDWNPLYYGEEGRSRVGVRVVEGRPRVVAGSGLFRRVTALSALPPFVFLGARAVGPWFALYRAVQVRGGLTAVLPGERAAVPVEGGRPEPVTLDVAGKPLPAELYTVRVGGREVRLFGQGDLLLGGEVPGEGLVFYLREVLPGGLKRAG